MADLRQAIQYRRNNALEFLFPETGPLRRERYEKHLEFFRAGALRRSRCFLAGNRVGKSVAGAYEMVLHLTGRYPKWWPGKRFARGVKAWACGLTNTKVRDSLQVELLGQIVRDAKGPKNQIVGIGTGMIPKDAIVSTRPKQGISDAIDSVHIRHESGTVSTLIFKSYDSGVDAFSAEKVHVIHLDEEPEEDIVTECALRGATVGGILMITATPLLGMTPLMVKLMDAFRSQPELQVPSTDTYVVMATWDDAPHLTENDKAELLAKIPAYQRDARMRGLPQMGSGAIYPIAESLITVAPFEIPDHWPRSFGMDVGNNTAAIWGTHDRSTGIYYLYREYFRAGDVEAIAPGVHATAIRGHRNQDAWIPGVIDPASRGRSQTDGNELMQMYKDLGLNVIASKNAVEPGLYEILDAFQNGRLKVFLTLTKFFEEFRLYQRDKNGKVRKERDHCCDAMRYWWLSGRDIMRTKPRDQPLPGPNMLIGPDSGQNWMRS